MVRLRLELWGKEEGKDYPPACHMRRAAPRIESSKTQSPWPWSQGISLILITRHTQVSALNAIRLHLLLLLLLLFLPVVVVWSAVGWWVEVMSGDMVSGENEEDTGR